jgi:hypothetical protein
MDSQGTPCHTHVPGLALTLRPRGAASVRPAHGRLRRRCLEGGPAVSVAPWGQTSQQPADSIMQQAQEPQAGEVQLLCTGCSQQ